LIVGQQGDRFGDFVGFLRKACVYDHEKCHSGANVAVLEVEITIRQGGAGIKVLISPKWHVKHSRSFVDNVAVHAGHYYAKLLNFFRKNNAPSLACHWLEHPGKTDTNHRVPLGV
jgi:hypothetical protein